MADLDGDSKLDVAVGFSSGESFRVLLGNGDGTFKPAVTSSSGCGPRSIAVANLNGDGTPELISHSVDWERVTLHLREAGGHFVGLNVVPTATIPTAIAAADFNRDGKQDLAVAQATSVVIVLGNGDRTFGARTDHETGDVPVALAGSDTNGDDQLDLVTANRGGKSVTMPTASPTW